MWRRVVCSALPAATVHDMPACAEVAGQVSWSLELLSGWFVAVWSQVMEVLELPRGTALELLAEHRGDPQAVILSVLGG